MKRILSVLLISILCLSIVGCQKEVDIEQAMEEVDKYDEAWYYEKDFYKCLLYIFEDGVPAQDDIDETIKHYYVLKNSMEGIDVELLEECVDYCIDIDENKAAKSVQEVLNEYSGMEYRLKCYEKIIYKLENKKLTLYDIDEINDTLENLDND